MLYGQHTHLVNSSLLLLCVKCLSLTFFFFCDGTLFSSDTDKPKVTDEPESTTSPAVSTAAPSSSSDQVLSTAESTLGTPVRKRTKCITRI